MLAILVKAQVLTNEAAEKLSRSMGADIHRADYTDAVQMIEVYTEDPRFPKLIAEPWLAEIERLQKRVRDLEEVVKEAALKKVAPPAKKPAVKAPAFKPEAVTASGK